MAAINSIVASRTLALGHGHLPTKRSINLAGVTEKKINLKIAIPAIILIVIAAALFSKFMVADKLAAVAKATSEVSDLRSQLDAGYAKLREYDTLDEKYAHYTYSGMTEEELSRADRVEVIDMISRVVEPYARIDSWGLNSNQLTMTITAASLTEVNTVSHSLQTEELVDFSTVTTASTREMYGTDEAGDVTANIVVYLKSPVKGGEDQ